MVASDDYPMSFVFEFLDDMLEALFHLQGDSIGDSCLFQHRQLLHVRSMKALMWPVR